MGVNASGLRKRSRAFNVQAKSNCTVEYYSAFYSKPFCSRCLAGKNKTYVLLAQ